MRKKGVTFIGTMLVDYVKMINAYPPEGSLCHMGEISQCIGGLAANTAVDLKILAPHLHVAAMSMVGKDDGGQYIREKVASYGVDVSGIKVHPTLPTPFTDVMTVASTGARTFFQQQGANAVYGYDDVDFDGIETSMVHLGYVLLMKQFDSPDPQYGTVLARIMHELNERGIDTSIDLVSSVGDRYEKVVVPSLPYTDYLFMNEIEASGTTGIPIEGEFDDGQAKRLCVALLEKGVRKMVILHAPKGGWAMKADGTFYAQPSLKLPEDYIKGSVGAGDAFCAGMLYGIVEGLSPQEGLSIGNRAAAANLSHSNSIDGMRSLDQLPDFPAR